MSQNVTSVSRSRRRDQQHRIRPQIAIAACVRCRRSKIRCNTSRPSCSTCQIAGATCSYETNIDESRAQAIRRKHDELDTMHQNINETLAWMKEQSAHVVHQCFNAMSASQDPAYELCVVVAAHRERNSIESSLRNTIPARPSISDHFDLRSSLRFPTAYPWLGASAAGSTVESHRRSSAQAASVKLLRELDIGLWTTVPISNDLAVNLLLAYLETEHPIYGFFDPDLFLSSLLSYDTSYCSALLVNVILYWTSSTYAPRFPQARDYAKSLAACVHLLLDSEQSNDCPLTVASLVILALASICRGDDKQAKRYMMTGIQMAEALHLLGEGRHGSDIFASTSANQQSMLEWVSRGAFNFSTVYTLHFQDITSRCFTKLPPLLLPPQGSRLSKELGIPDTFSHFCRFWCIVHGILAVYFSAPQPLVQHIPQAFTDASYQRLLRWSEGLPDDALRSENMRHNVAEMHICYHATLMDLFRPFLGQKQLTGTCSPKTSSAEEAFALSFMHLRALTDYYHSAFSQLSASHTVSWIHGPLYVASCLVTYGDSATRTADFLRSMYAFSPLLEAHAVVRTFVKGLFGMAVSAHMMTARKAEQHMRDLWDSLTGTHGNLELVLESQVIIDQHLAMENRSAAVSDILAAKYDELILFENYFELESIEVAK